MHSWTHSRASSKDIFVTGTDTGVGKTVLSALLVAALNRKYWKPIQTGACEGTDRQAVTKYAEVLSDRTCPEAYVFDPPVSPHLAAAEKGMTIDLPGISRPSEAESLVIEGAGGVLVPINKDAFMLDLMRKLEADVIVAARTTLGTINHTLLSLSALSHAGIPVLGVVMIGNENPDNRRSIETFGNVPVIGTIPWLDVIDRKTLCHTFEQHFDKTVFGGMGFPLLPEEGWLRHQ